MVTIRHRLQREAAVLAALHREAILAQRLLVVPLLPEREAEVVVRQRTALGHLGLGALLHAQLLTLPLGVVALEGEVGLRARQRRGEVDGAPRRGAPPPVGAPGAPPPPPPTMAGCGLPPLLPC